jgi:hypothetical protein
LFKYGSLSNVQVMAGVTINEGTSPADSDLTMYMEKAATIIDDSLKGMVSVPLNPAPEAINTAAEFYASGLYLARNNLPESQTQHPNVLLAQKMLTEYKASLRRSFKLISSK